MQSSVRCPLVSGPDPPRLPPAHRRADENKKGCRGPGSYPVTAGPALHTGHSRQLLVDAELAAFRTGPLGLGEGRAGPLSAP